MMCVINLYWLVLAIILVSKCFVHVQGEPQVPCYFIFGDSLVDCGNNNNLSTEAKANYFPYGIDFPHGPTGRFTNGRTTADIIGELLGLGHYIPSFLTVKDTQMLKGVNYASGSAGILYETGRHMGPNINLNKQIKNHQIIVSKIATRLGNKASAKDHLSKCLYYFVIGSNDYINNYFKTHLYNSRSEYSPDQFAEKLIQEYSQQIRTLYSYGARKVALSGSPAVGCAPYASTNYGANGSICVDKINDATNIFNGRLKLLVDHLNNDLKDAKFVYMDSEFVSGTSIPGMNNKSECCEVNEEGQCVTGKRPCPNRNLQLFWDSFHTTEVVNQIVARTIYPTLIQIL